MIECIGPADLAGRLWIKDTEKQRIIEKYKDQIIDDLKKDRNFKRVAFSYNLERDDIENIYKLNGLDKINNKKIISDFKKLLIENKSYIQRLIKNGISTAEIIRTFTGSIDYYYVFKEAYGKDWLNPGKKNIMSNEKLKKDLIIIGVQATAKKYKVTDSALYYLIKKYKLNYKKIDKYRPKELKNVKA